MQAENSPPPPHHFSNGPSLITHFAYATMCLQMSKMLLIYMVLILHIHEIIDISLKLIIPSESRRKAPGREVYNPVTREALVFPTSIATPALFSLCYKSVEFGLYPPRLAYKSSSIFFHECEAGAVYVDFVMFSVAKASERTEARLDSPAKNRIKTLFTWSGGPRSSGVGFFCFHALGDTKQKKPTPLGRGPPLHVNRS